MSIDQRCWTTEDEIKVINFMAKTTPRKKGLLPLEIVDCQARLLVYINTLPDRIWGAPVDVKKCRFHAIKRYEELSGRA